MNTEAPVLLGVCGPAGSGKTVTAESLAPTAQTPSDAPIIWTKLAYALPLKRMASARQKIQGDDVGSRVYYELHAALDDLFRRGISYEELVDMVYEVSVIPCDPEGKPREFLQYVGTEICRAADPDCFVKWMNRKIREEYLLFEREQQARQGDIPDELFGRKHLGVVIDDIRFKNECELVHNHPNGILIYLTASPECRSERLERRDGNNFNPLSLQHISENQFQNVPEDWYDSVINTTGMSIKEQMEQITTVLMKHI